MSLRKPVVIGSGLMLGFTVALAGANVAKQGGEESPAQPAARAPAEAFDGGGGLEVRIEDGVTTMNVFPLWEKEFAGFDDLLADSDLVVVGRTAQVSQRVQQDPGASVGLPITSAVIEVEDVWFEEEAGSAPQRFVVEQIGGTMDTVVQVSPENPLFRQGDRSVWVVEHRGRIGGLENYQPVGGYQGRFRLVGGQVVPIDPRHFAALAGLSEDELYDTVMASFDRIGN